MIYLPDTLLYKLDSARIGTAMAVAAEAVAWHRGSLSEAAFRSLIERSIKANDAYLAEWQRQFVREAKEGEAT